MNILTNPREANLNMAVKAGQEGKPFSHNHDMAMLFYVTVPLTSA